MDQVTGVYFVLFTKEDCALPSTDYVLGMLFLMEISWSIHFVHDD